MLVKTSTEQAATLVIVIYVEVEKRYCKLQPNISSKLRMISSELRMIASELRMIPKYHIKNLFVESNSAALIMPRIKSEAIILEDVRGDRFQVKTHASRQILDLGRHNFLRIEPMVMIFVFLKSQCRELSKNAYFCPLLNWRSSPAFFIVPKKIQGWTKVYSNTCTIPPISWAEF